MSHDWNLQQAVLAELSWEPSVTAAHIGVTAKDGVITLTGSVDSYAEKHAAEEAARRVKGVKGLAEETEVRLSFETQRTDEEIAAAAIDRLSWDVSVPRDAVTVTVEKGWVTLAGEVGWHFQKDAAEQDVRRLWGVVGVSNQVTIKPTVSTDNISTDIMHAMHRSSFFDAETVQVTAEGGKIHLTGKVHSQHERRVAAATAWGARGATEVQNDIVVI